MAWRALLMIGLSLPALAWASAEDAAPPMLRLVYYRGPGGGDRYSAPKLCDGDPATEWSAAGLSKTTLGPPFEFVFEFPDRSERELAGVRLQSTGAVTAHRARAFEIRVSPEGGDDFAHVVYSGEQRDGTDPQSHLFEKPIRVRRFQLKLLSNHGDPDHAQANEFWPIFDAAETAAALAGAPLDAVPFAEPEAPDPLYADAYPYTKVVRPAVPAVTDHAHVANPLDAFILAKLEEAGLPFAPLASKEILIRRVTYDLTGLPPTPEEIDAFVADDSADAWERLVERLLATPRFGERMAQHWLDVVRYADTDGYAADAHRPSAWRYRDYVIAAFNDDKPYDRFILEQLAADELDPVPIEALPALGFARLAPFRTNSGNQNLERNRQELLTEITGSVGSMFLGMTIGCARCHDHKIDPIPQTDYYRLEAYFAAAEPALLTMATPEEQRKWKQQAAAARGEIAQIEKAESELREQLRARVVSTRLAKLDETTREAVLTVPSGRSEEQQQLASAIEADMQPAPDEITTAATVDEQAQLTALRTRKSELQRRVPAELPVAWGIQNSGRFAPTTYVLHRGQIENKSARVEPRVPGALPDADQSAPSSPGGTSLGRRRALAEWLVGPGRGQTARVMANRLWQVHFSRGIVGTPSDFGSLGEPATHPELLDWLADELIQSGWSLKHLHRLMVLSRTYRQSSETTAGARKADELNDLFSRCNRRRLTAEEIRDSVLVLTGAINNKMGGPGVTVPQPPDVLAELKNPWNVTPNVSEHSRRSIYLFAERKLRLPLLETFDQPDTMTACARRSETTHALQSLALLNNEWMIEQAGQFALQLESAKLPTDEDRIRFAYRLITGRDASESELRIARDFLRNQRETVADKAWTDLALVLFNLNRFLYVD